MDENKHPAQVPAEGAPAAPEREFSFRALFWGVVIGLILLALMIYLDAVAGLDMNVSPIASVLGIFLIPLIGGKTSTREVNIMQTCASAVAFSCAALSSINVAAMMLGREFSFIGALVPVLLANTIGICVISIFRKQYVEDPSLSFPQSIMAKTAVEKVGKLSGRDARLIFLSAAVGLVITLAQNLGYLPITVDFTSYLPSGMTLGVLLMPMMLGMGYILGSRAGLLLIAASLLVNLVLAPIGTHLGWFTDPGTDYSAMQNFNLPMVVGISLFAALVPMVRQRKSFVAAFRFDKKAIAADRHNVPIKTMLLLLAASILALAVFCHFFYAVSFFQMLLFILMGILFSFVCVRVVAESGLSAAMALGICQIIIVNWITGDILLAMLVCMISTSIAVLAQNTMGDLKTGQLFGSSPRKQIWAQFVGIIPGCIIGVVILSALLKAYNAGSELFTFPLGRIYYSLGAGISGSGSGIFHLGRFALGGGIGTLLSLLGLPAGGIALAAYLAPSTILSIGLGGLIRLVVDKLKGETFGEWLVNAATGLVIGDGLVSIIIAFLTTASF